jgi:hypothetical protein
MKGIHKLGLSGKMVHMANLWAPADQLLEIVGPGSAEDIYVPPTGIRPSRRSE